MPSPRLGGLAGVWQPARRGAAWEFRVPVSVVVGGLRTRRLVSEFTSELTTQRGLTTRCLSETRTRRDFGSDFLNPLRISLPHRALELGSRITDQPSFVCVCVFIVLLWRGCVARLSHFAQIVQRALGWLIADELVADGRDGWYV